MSEDDSFCAEIIWKIENFSCCWHKEGEMLESPTFKLDVLKDTKWCLEVFPRGHLDFNVISVYLYKISTIPISIGQLTFSLMKNETALVTEISGVLEFPKETLGRGFTSFVTHVDMLAKQEDYLPNDVLTLSCQIWPVSKVSPELGVSKQFLSTCLKVEKFPFTWKIENFSRVTSIPKIIIPCAIPKEGITATITFFYFADVGNERIGINISGEYVKDFSWKCVFRLLDSKQHYLLCNGDFLLEKCSEKKLNYQKSFEPIVNRKHILQNGDIYLIRDELSLDCQLTFTIHDTIESIQESSKSCENSIWFLSTDTSKDDQSISSKTLFNTGNVDANDQISSKAINHSTNSSLKLLQLNIFKFYQSGSLSDFSLQAESEIMPVHSLILSAQSPVFKRMLECNMKEKKERSVKLEDLDIDTARKMLDYIYTEELNDLTAEICLKLYYAGDKYEIIGLKTQTSDFLKMHMSLTNVYDVLVLADRHNDQELKSCVLKFMFKHEKETLRSEDFKDFMKENGPLALETMIELSNMRLL